MHPSLQHSVLTSSILYHISYVYTVILSSSDRDLNHVVGRIVNSLPAVKVGIFN